MLVRLLPILLVFALLASCSAPEGPTPLSPELEEASAVIDEAFLREAVAEFSADEMAGRGPGTAGDSLARAYLAERLAELGLEPAFVDEAGQPSWEQRFPVLGFTSALPETWSFETPAGTLAFRRDEEYAGGTGLQEPAVEIENAELVFVGYGIEAPEEDWDDFKGADLRGKMLLMLNDDPNWDPELFAGDRKLYYGRWTYKYESAARQGAAGAIIIHTTPSAGYPWAVVKSSWSGEQVEAPAGDEPRVPFRAWLTEDAAARLVAAAGQDLISLVEAARSREFRPVPLDARTSIQFDVAVRETETANVAGILRGRDPQLAERAIVFSAHHDHLGIGPADASGDTIYNGALDNGAAVASALGVMRAFTALPERPRRSVLVAFVAAEEQGLIGSRYFAEHPPIPAESLVANINFELGNIWGVTDDVTVYGMGKSELEDRLAEEAARQGRTLHEEPDRAAGWFYRSDQFSFARVGVPAIWFKAGTAYRGQAEGWGEEVQQRWIEERYHRPSDELTPEWRFDGLVEDARLAFLLGWRVAEEDAEPAWYPEDEFARLRERGER